MIRKRREISVYGTNIALADALGETEVSALLNETLKVEEPNRFEPDRAHAAKSRGGSAGGSHLDVLLVLFHRYPTDSRARRAPLPPECPLERGDIDVMQQSREPRLA
jgi:hypothetical protein